MLDREKVIAKLEKEVKKTYSIKTTIYNNGKKVKEDITEHREPGVKISMEMADEILALLKEQEAVVRCKDCEHSEPWYGDKSRCFLWHETGIDVFNDGFCNYGKRKEGR